MLASIFKREFMTFYSSGRLLWDRWMDADVHMRACGGGAEPPSWISAGHQDSRSGTISPAHFQPRFGCRLAKLFIVCCCCTVPLFHLLPVLPLDTEVISPLILQSRSVLYSGHVGVHIRALQSVSGTICLQRTRTDDQRKTIITVLLDKLNIYHSGELQ